MDIIHIKDLEVFANHGVFQEENAIGQKFVVCADLYLDFSEAVACEKECSESINVSDILPEYLDLSINYSLVCDMIESFMQTHTYRMIETAACELCDHLLSTFTNLKKVNLEIKKPWAPIKHPLDYVSVEVSRGWHTAYLSLGSNMCDRNAYIENALSAMEAYEFIRPIKISRMYETEPYGVVEQDMFLNCCVSIMTTLEPMELLAYVNQLEADNGRERTVHWGPRTLDIDILLYDDVIIRSKKLCIPHIDMANRMFVLEPLNEIAPFAYNPVKQKTVNEMLEELVQIEKNKSNTI